MGISGGRLEPLHSWSVVRYKWDMTTLQVRSGFEDVVGINVHILC